MKYSARLTCLSLALLLASASSLHAESIAGAVASQHKDLTKEQRRALAKSFLTRMKTGMAKADTYLQQVSYAPYAEEENILPEGEMLLLQPLFPPNLKLDGVITGQVQNRQILLSIKDMASVLQFPIAVDEKGEIASGWYIRANKEFFVDAVNKEARTDHGSFKTQAILSQDGDIFVSAKELEKWLDIEFELDISAQEMKVISEIPLPLQERYARRKMLFSSNEVPAPSLPRGGEEYKAIGVPAVDIATNSNYRRQDKNDPISRHQANIRTVGDLAYGTLSTQTLLNNQEQIDNIRVTYQRESEKADLLGKLKARKFEIGDVSTTRVPIIDNVRQELGARITNVDPLKGTSRPTTVISGDAFPGWDVELYRDSQLVGFQEVGEDGRYQFDEVILFQSDNNFRVVFYGPQGETREEKIYVPVDTKRLSEGGGVYDVSLTMNDKQAYRKDTGIEDEDEGTPTLSAIYERPILPGTSGYVGMRSAENQGTRDTVATAGISTIALGTLVNADVGVDDEGETSAELALRRSFGAHDVGNTLTWMAQDFDSQSGGESNDVGSFQNTFNMIGPLPFLSAIRPRYSLSANSTQDTEGDYAHDLSASVNGVYKNFNVNEQLIYQTSSTAENDRVASLTNITGSYGRNRLRIGTDYTIKPESELSRVLANYRRYINRSLDFELDAEHRKQQKLTEYSARLDWQAGFIRISPRISYNTQNEFFAGLSTRMGFLKEPHYNDIKMFDRTLTSNGAVSAFVYLDKDGNGSFNEGDDPLPDVVVRSLQNGGRADTDANGIALFTKMREMKLTDISVDPETLQDPSWISGFEGVSILPRAGYVASIEFPIHISGEVDGMVYLNDAEGQQALRDIPLSLYNDKGEVEATSITDPGGFYYFTHVPPGRYFLIIDETSAARGNFIRPEPQAIEIGYDGTVMYGNDIIVEGGDGDIPSTIMANLEDYKARHPHINFAEDNYDIVLNLGEYNSSLLMSVVWYKLKTRFAPMLSGGHLFIPPTESYADTKTGKHTLRVGMKDETINGAYNRCKSLMARDRFCKVEIYPAYMKQAQVETAAPVDMVARQ